mmetsp:Transcript_44222/g.143481  ORF Transcript_44222/g.143481 Transcript_44222/m.143481 type:complete len:261 (-) Transcript_44222:107-889(-)
MGFGRSVRGAWQKGGNKNQKQVQVAETKAAAAAAASSASSASEDEEEVAGEVEEYDVRRCRPNTTDEEDLRRRMIIHKFKILGEPPEVKWKGKGGTVALIADWLDVPKGRDLRPIFRTLQRYAAGEPLVQYSGGAQPKLTHGQALIAADCLHRRFSWEQTAYMVTNWRNACGEGSVSRTAGLSASRSGAASEGGGKAGSPTCLAGTPLRPTCLRPSASRTRPPHAASPLPHSLRSASASAQRPRRPDGGSNRLTAPNSLL